MHFSSPLTLRMFPWPHATRANKKGLTQIPRTRFVPSTQERFSGDFSCSFAMKLPKVYYCKLLYCSFLAKIILKRQIMMDPFGIKRAVRPVPKVFNWTWWPSTPGAMPWLRVLSGAQPRSCCAGLAVKRSVACEEGWKLEGLGLLQVAQDSLVKFHWDTFVLRRVWQCDI